MKWVKQCVIQTEVLLKIKRVGSFRRFYIFTLHAAAYVSVPKLVMYIHAMLCPARWRHSIAGIHITRSVSICVQGTRSLTIAYLDDCMVFISF